MAFKMNRPIIKGSALHKSSQNIRVNPNDLRKTSYKPDSPFRQDDEYQKGGFSNTYLDGGGGHTGDQNWHTYQLLKEYKDLSEQYVKEKQRWEASNTHTGDLGEDMEDGWYDKMYAMRNKLWELSAEVKAEEQSKPVQSAERDIKGGGTYEYISDMWGDSITPIWTPEERKQQKLIKIPPRSAELLPTSEMDAPKKIPPYDLVKHRSSHFTIQRQGLHSGTYPKGEDGRVLIKLKDKSGRVVWKGSQTEYEEKYGDWLERGDTEYGERKDYRLYLRDEEGVSLPPSKTVWDKKE
jgi:hypothetical protein